MEEFDWEAAIREIDLAGLKTSDASSSSSHPSITNNNSVNGTKPLAKKQSTLDRFMDHKPPLKNQVVFDPTDEFECGKTIVPLLQLISRLLILGFTQSSDVAEVVVEVLEFSHCWKYPKKESFTFLHWRNMKP